jgi:hypothetical protein
MSCNSNSRHVMISGLTLIVSIKVMGCNTAKDIWDKIQNIHEGDLKVK